MLDGLLRGGIAAETASWARRPGTRATRWLISNPDSRRGRVRRRGGVREGRLQLRVGAATIGLGCAQQEEAPCAGRGACYHEEQGPWQVQKG